MQTQMQVGQTSPTNQGEQTTTQGEPIMQAGTRFEYAQSPYRDVVFGIIFVLMLLVMIIVVLIKFSSDTIDSEFGIIIGFLVLLMAIGAAAGVVGLQVIKCIPETIIKLMLFSLLGIYVIAGIVLIGYGNYGGIVFLIIAFIVLIYMWIVWSRIPFSAALLKISATICSTYSGVLWVAIIALVLQFLFIILWILFFVAVYSADMNGILYFLLILSYYWGVQVFAMVSHTTSCGVAATWFFYKNTPENVSWNALKRTLTTSFGSVCFGSFIVAIVQTIRAFARMGGGGRNPFALICILILCCFERLIRFFTEYGFAYVAIYGQSYYISAKMTWELLERRGWWAIVNNSVVGIAIVGGALIAGVVVCVIGVLIGSGYDSSDVSIILGILGFFVGYFMAIVILKPVKSMVTCLFVCYAEDPETLKQNHPDDYNRLTSVEPRLIVVVQVVMVQQQPGVMMMQPVGVQIQGQGPMMMQPQMQVQMQQQPMMMQQQQMMMQQQPMMMQQQPMMMQQQQPNSTQMMRPQ